MSVVMFTPIILNTGVLYSNTLLTNATETISYKFFAARNIDRASVKFTIQSVCIECPAISVQIQANSLPSVTSNMDSALLYPNKSDENELEIYPRSNLWHYIDIGFVLDDKNTSKDMNESVLHCDFTIQVDLHFAENSNDGIEPVSVRPFAKRNIEFYALLRQTYREFFMFDYDLLPDANGTVPTYINLTGGIPAGFRFELGDIYDIGGTLSFAVAMNETLKDSIPLERAIARGDIGTAIAEKLVDTKNGDPEESKSTARSNQTIIVCMRLEEPGIPTWPDKCLYGRNLMPAASIINNTNEDTSTGLIHVPFPETGNWYVTLGLFCHGAETAAKTTIIDSVKEFIKQHISHMDDMRTPCACRNQSDFYRECIQNSQCLASMNETETLKVKECLMDPKCTRKSNDIAVKFDSHHKFATEQIVASDSSCTASAVFTISSSPCVAGRCGRYGRCYHYMSGGFVFSTCLCIKGYRGWDCTEDSQVPSSFSILLALLLLTLSNLLFIPSIYFAMKRLYYTEAVIYFFAMFFSIFYHACDSGEDEYSFCMVKLSVLQFCDFYCGLLAIWVTLIAMAHVRQNLVSLLHMFGAILLAFGTELNKQSLWVFLAPALTGICIISVSWGMRCRKTRKWFPARRYLAIYFPIGIVLVMVGLVCYAFLQTRQNYHIVHSVWHMVMALSILCLLPSRQTFIPKS